MPIRCKRFSNWFHLSLLRDRWKLIFPDKRQTFNFCKFQTIIFQDPLTIIKGNFWRLQKLFVFQKNIAVIRKFFQSCNNCVDYDSLLCILCDIEYLSSILMFKKMLCEWGLWNNSWVKNLPVRPLAPRRKTPGQLYPTFRPPGQGQKIWLSFYLQDLDVIIIATI